MYQAAWFFSGAWLQNKCSTCQLPQLRRATDDRGACRLFVRLLGASVPGLAEPGLLMREHPCVEVAFGDAVKAKPRGTRELFRVDPAQRKVRKENSAPTSLQDCEWRLGDTMVFTVQLSELASGLSLRLYTRSDMRLGPLQLDLARPSQVGCCTLDLRRRILPACSQQKMAEVAGKNRESDMENNSGLTPSQELWESEEMPLPLVTADGADERAWLLVSFALSVNPSWLEKLASRADRTLVERVSDGVSHLGRQAQPALQWASDCCAAETARSTQERIVVSMPAMEQEGIPTGPAESDRRSPTATEMAAEPAPEPPALSPEMNQRLPLYSPYGRHFVPQSTAPLHPAVSAAHAPYAGLSPAWAWYQPQTHGHSGSQLQRGSFLQPAAVPQRLPQFR
ncbi:cbh2 [Symbiodinium pilosum]|uniref:Cbh2 protein n=1 Tax=Symbiodinium pilosum TaxID=2952 RepID=A0A812YEP9_SYMPI|nr:cbh2 [Symbiodinium pilosum]